MVPYYALDEREPRRFFDALFHKLDYGHQIELRWKPPNGGTMRKRFFGTPEEALAFGLALGTSHEVYVGVAPRRGEDGTREGVTYLQTVWADLDTKGDHTPKSRIVQLKDLPYHPSIVVCSGGGLHVYWLLEQPVEGAEELTEAESVMRRLVEGLGGDPVHDLPRILRLPGTLNHKEVKPRPVRLVRCEPGERFTLDQLREMAEALPEKKSTRSRNSAVGSRPTPRLRRPETEVLGLAPDLSRLPKKIRDLIKYGNRGEYPCRSKADFNVCVAMFCAGYDLVEVWTIMTHPENGISEKYFEKGRGGEDYLERTISNAHEHSKIRSPRRVTVYARRRGGVSIG